MPPVQPGNVASSVAFGHCPILAKCTRFFKSCPRVPLRLDNGRRIAVTFSTRIIGEQAMSLAVAQMAGNMVLKRNMSYRRVGEKKYISSVMLVLSLVGLLIGCGRDSQSTGPSNKLRVGYIGLTCEAPIFTAVEKGFFKEEGLDVSLVKCEWANYKDVLALGGFDVTHHLIMYFLKPIEQGLDVKFTGGIHRGCLRVQGLAKSDIRTIKDLRGKRIGVPGMGTPPFIFANRVLGANGIDPKTEVTWLVFPAGEL